MPKMTCSVFIYLSVLSWTGTIKGTGTRTQGHGPRDTDTRTQAKSTWDNNNLKKCANQKKIAHEQFYGVFKKHAPNHGCLFTGIVQRYKKITACFECDKTII